MTDWIEKHSVNCYHCDILFDERDSCGTTTDGGDVCPDCANKNPPCDACLKPIPPSQMFDRRELYRGDDDLRYCDDCIADAWAVANFGEDGLH